MNNIWYVVDSEGRDALARSAARKENKQLPIRQDRMIDMYFISPRFVHALFKIFIIVGFTNRMADSHPVCTGLKSQIFPWSEKNPIIPWPKKKFRTSSDWIF
jgi:hypothetical protein